MLPGPDISSDTYFAVEPDAEKAVAGIMKRAKRYREALSASGRLGRMRRNWNAWRGYGARGDSDASDMQAAGDGGEMVKVNVNHFASLVNQVVVLTTNTKPATRAIAENGDYENLAAAQLADAINDHYDRELNISDTEYDATLSMVLLSESCVVQTWDATQGDAYTVDESGRQVNSGDVRLYSLTPLDYVVDPDVRDLQSHRWMCWRQRVNRYELAARFPAQRDDILAHERERPAEKDTFDDFVDAVRYRSTDKQSDTVWVWEFRHIRTPACPNGRMLRFLSEKCVLFDSMGKTPDGQPADFGYTYGDDLMATFAAPERIPGTGEGHTSFFDLLGLQEGVNLSASIMASAINAGGMQNLYVPRGANVTAEKLTGALNVIEFDGPTMPQAKENVAINPAVPSWADMCVNWMRQRVSLNDVVLGDPQKGMPAQAMALLRAQAVEFHSRLQAAYETLIQRNRTNVLKLLQKYAQTERVALVAGKANTWALKSFSGQTLKGVKGFVIEAVNPAMKTLAGRVGFVQPLLDKGQVSLPDYFQFMQTGRTDFLTRSAGMDGARRERNIELLMQGVGLPPIRQQPGPDGMMTPVLDANGMPMLVDDGQPHVRPVVFDAHWDDIKAYRDVLAQPEARDNPQVVAAVMGVIHYQLQLWRQMDPALIMILKGPMPPPPMQPGMGPPPGPPGPPGPPPSHGGPPPKPDEPGAHLPQPPKNPITGEAQPGANPPPAPPQA